MVLVDTLTKHIEYNPISGFKFSLVGLFSFLRWNISGNFFHHDFFCVDLLLPSDPSTYTLHFRYHDPFVRQFTTSGIVSWLTFNAIVLRTRHTLSSSFKAD